MFDDASHISRLKEIRNNYFGADNNERNRLKSEFQDLQMAMLESRISARDATSGLYNTLSSWRPFKHEATEWFDAEWMFGLEGFDIVIANPPYVGEKGNKTTFDELKTTSLGKRFYKGKMDLFYFFFHLGLDALKDGGVLTFITTNYYPTADGAIKLRKDFYERTNIVRLINFGEITVFDSARGQHNLITILQRSVAPSADYETEEIVASSKGSISSGTLTNVLAGESELVHVGEVKKSSVYDSIGDKFYIRFSGGELGVDIVLNKISDLPSLTEYSNVNTGMYTSADKVLTIKYDEVLNKIGDINEVEESVLRPLYKNSDVNRYTTAHATNLAVIYHHEKQPYSLSDIPNIFRYLEKHKDKLSSRRDGTYLGGPHRRGRWDVVANPKYIVNFSGPKIVAPQRSLRNTFGYNDIPWYASADVYFITAKDNVPFEPFYLLGVLNSKLIYTWLYHRGKRKGQMLELYRTPLSEIPIAAGTPDQKQAIEKLVREIIAIKTTDPTADTTAPESQIDQLVYQLYNLTPEEIAIVEAS
jgi:adenine-specific DNA-methyltransferase